MLFKQCGALQTLAFNRKNVLALSAAILLSIQGSGFARAQTVFDARAEKASGVAMANTADATVTYEENGTLSEELNVPVYTWKKAAGQPRGVILAVHGLAMHGKAYDQLGRTLAEKGYVVVSTDLHGYGSYIGSNHKYCDQGESHCKEKTNYCRSFADLSAMVKNLKQRYPSVPLFAVGESLGGALAIRLAGTHPDLIDGLVLSAPALRHHTFIDPNLITDASLCMTNWRHQVDLNPFVKRYSSDDPRIIEEILSDPMARRRLSAYELLQVSNCVHKTVPYVSRISPETPVLVIQGGADRCVKAEAVMLLLSQLRSTDQTVKWFHHRGHILIETSYIKPDTMDSVVGWLESHVNNPQMQAKYGHGGDIAAGIIPEPQVGLAVNAMLYGSRDVSLHR
jgi:alpha-beta hydrolase superfamily lysophospholipase